MRSPQLLSLLFFWLCAFSPFVHADFVHPGVLFDQADLNRIRSLRNTAPWSSALASIQNSTTGRTTYAMRGPYAAVSRNPDLNRNAIEYDARAAYDQAMLWSITGNQTYANKAIQILNGWSATLNTVLGGVEAQLLGAEIGFNFAIAAEILRHTASGWSESEALACESMLLTYVYPAVAVPGDANWGAGALSGAMAIAVFCDDVEKFQVAVEFFRRGSNGSMAKNILPSGVESESGRDQEHAGGGIGAWASAAEIAWKQGVDLYAEGNNRLLAASEYWCAYNLGETVPFQPFGRASDGFVYTQISADGRGTIPWFHADLIYTHYATRRGMNQQGRTLAYRDTLSTDARNLLYFRHAAAPAVAPSAPLDVSAASAGNRRIAVSWSAVPEATGYTVMRNSVGGGWVWGDVIATGLTATTFIDTQLAANTTYYYVVAAETASARSAWSAQAFVTTAHDPNWIAVSCGNPHAESVFQSDAYYSGGNADGIPRAYRTIDRGGLGSPAPERVYALCHWGTSFSYTFPGFTPGSTQKVRLHFAEIAKTGAGQRVFHVNINGTRVLANYDIFTAAGAAYKGVVREFTATANASGQIVIQFTRVTDNAICVGIEIGSPPAIPAGFAAVAGPSGVALSWSSSSGAVGYTLKRSLVSGGPYTPVASGLAASAYLDAAARDGATYHYVVSATTASNESADSAEVLVASLASVPITSDEIRAPLIALVSGRIVLTQRTTVVGHDYQPQFCDDLVSGDWQNHGESLAGTGGEISVSLPLPEGSGRRFYRILIGP